MNQMYDPQRILVEDHIQALEHEAAALRAERERDHRRADSAQAPEAAAEAPAFAVAAAVDVAAIGGAPVPASALIGGAELDHDGHDSTRIRLGRWLVGVGTAIAGSPEEIVGRTSGVVAASAEHPCDGGPNSLSHAA